MRGIALHHARRYGAAVLLALVSFLLTSHPASALPLTDASEFATPGMTATPVQFFFPNFKKPKPKPKAKRAKKRYRRRYRRYRRATKPKCTPPWTYSQGLRKCICVLEGYGLSNGECRKFAELCSEHGQWSEEEKKCRCDDGYFLKEGQCVDREVAAVAEEPRPGAQCVWPQIPDDGNEICSCAPGYKEDPESGRCLSTTARDNRGANQRQRADGILTTEIALIQQCLKEAGYLRGDIATRMTKRAWTAFWYFKQDHKVGSTPKGVHEAKAQSKLFVLCPLAARALYGFQRAALGDRNTAGRRLRDRDEEEVEEPLAPVKKVYAKPEAECLPDHLYKLIVRTYGKRPGLKRCTATCVAIPKGLSNREIIQLQARGVNWCRSCLELGSHLPLDDILRIERGANVQICTRPPTRLPRWQRADGAPRVAYTKVRRLYRTLPTANGHEKDIAVVIGNKNYQGGLPANESAHNNAGAMYALLTEHLGFDQEHIIDLRDATLEDMTRVFGGGEDESALAKRLQDVPGANVLIYFAGHGTTKLDQSESYLLPVDAVEHREERSAYPMSRLYANLERLEAKSVMLLLEAGFSRDQSDFVYAPNLPELTVRSLPPRSIRNLTVMTAAEKDQRTMDDPQYGIGLFTRYLIEGLAGRADLEPIGNNDLKIDAVELYAYTARMVDLAARKSYGMLQKPLMSGSGKRRVSSVQAQLQ